jgi:hypothetical protein
VRSDYRSWLEEQKYTPGTISAQVHRVGKVEELYGNLDDHHRDGSLQSVIDGLAYSKEDERRNRANPSRIPIEGNIRNGLQSYKNAVVRYRKFLTGWDRPDIENEPASDQDGTRAVPGLEQSSQKLSLERDMQAALRRNITQLKSSLSIADDGAERAVFSGLIDITCVDAEDDALVVVELKAGKADSRAIGQILGYMGDLAEEEEGRKVRGILVAHEFDKRVLSAARVVPSLSLMAYSIEFRFTVSD